MFPRFAQAAEDHLRMLREAGHTFQQGAKELSNLAESLEGEGNITFAEALRAVSRLHQVQAMSAEAQATSLALILGDVEGSRP